MFKSIEKIWKSQWRGQCIFSHGTSASKGCAVLIKKNCGVKIHFVKNDTLGRFNIIDLSVDNYRFTLCNIYAPNDDTPEFFQEIFSIVDKIKPDNYIVAGDFNTTLGHLDKKSSLGTNSSGHPRSTKIVITIYVRT